MRNSLMHNQGFTLIELSIVLVIIGLIVGGVLVGQDLIRAAAVRATITQIEKFNTAANTFRDKYGCLPGDVTPQIAAQFNLPTGTAGRPRNGGAGDGDCNGILQGFSPGLGTMLDWSLYGEPMMFFEDLSTAHLVEGTFDTYDPAGNSITTPDPYFPPAKLGNGNYILITSGGLGANTPFGTPGNGLNYFTILAPVLINGGGTCETCNAGLTVKQAYDIDLKIDDGMPTRGRVQAMFLGSNFATYGGTLAWSANSGSASSITCFDTTSNQYSVTQSNGAGVNCGLSIRMQAGD